MKINKIKGTFDFYGKEVEKYRYIEKVAGDLAQKFGFEEMITPMFEATEVFVRTAGDSSDIVNKEMYTFKDRGDKSLTLRPEATAGISRSFVENKLYVEPGLKKYYYFAQAFRCERPQAGRFRQFTQFGVEALGKESPYLDADIIYFGYSVLNKLGIKNVKLKINTLGSKEGRNLYSNRLREYFKDNISCMCDDCKKRLETNPLRILDCKIDSDNPVLINAPKIQNSLSEADNERFNKVLSILKELGVSYEVDSNLVRGLDYYNHTVFEFIYNEPNSSIYNLAILAGGRYNGLSKEFDGPDTDAIGFGAGVERLMVILEELNLYQEKKTKVDVVIVNVGENSKLTALKMAGFLRNNGVRCELDYESNSLKPQFKLCERKNTPLIIIIGDEEIEQGIFKLKNTETRTEEIKKIEELNDLFKIEGEKYAYQK